MDRRFLVCSPNIGAKHIEANEEFHVCKAFFRELIKGVA
jgi:hypothetical protein